MNGTMLISDSDDWVECEICGISFYPAAACWRAAGRSVERFFDLRGDFQRESVQALRKDADILQKLIVEDNRWDGDKKTRGGGQQSFGNAWRHSAQTGGAGVAQTGKGVNDAPDGAEQADEGRDGTCSGEPGHAFFGAANFFGRGELHIYGDGLQALEAWRLLGAGSGITHLILQFAISGGVNGGEGRAGGREGLRIRDAAGGSEDAEELIALPADTAEQAELLQDQAPRDDGEEQKQRENAASDHAGFLKNAAEVDE